ncbi:DNA-binding protein [Desulfovibrio sp. OttesenSCG-928-G11]|nr:DNA-binding protein [Desulfovibrio sp. OttesenSCG-928-G11]
MDKYLNTKKAATYCGYSHIYFARIMEDYEIPRYGPKRNRFKMSDLDDWMGRSDSFAKEASEENNGQRKREFRKVT